MDQQKFHEVEFGKTKFQVSTQGIIMFVIAMLLIMLSGLAIIFTIRKFISLPYIIALFTIYAIIAVGTGILAAYSINCMIVGKCIKLTWVFISIYIFITFLYFIIAILSYYRGGKIDLSSKPGKNSVSYKM